MKNRKEPWTSEPSGWQACVCFPDWTGRIDDTLALNSMYSFYGNHGQGSLWVQVKETVTSFRMYVNGTRVETSCLTGGSKAHLDISAYTKNGENTVQVSNITPTGRSGAVTLWIPYPQILSGTPEEEGISREALDMIDALISSDVENGFPGAQLAVIRHGRLVYEKAWGKTNKYLPDGSTNTLSPDVTTETLYDLASVTKMFSVNYALQKLVTDGLVCLDSPVMDFLGEEFAGSTALSEYLPEGTFPASDPETIRKWKASLRIRDLLYHQGGFPADIRYYAPCLYKKDAKKGDVWTENPGFVGNGADRKTREATLQAICRTPLIYRPGTKTLYSDLDYMILGLVVERITGKDLNTWLKETFWEPLGLARITYNPLENSFSKEDCAATELAGNTRDGLFDFPGYRTGTLQGEVHDEKAWYCMGGISGHAGLFANASDLARLAAVMLCGGYGRHRFFAKSVMEQFAAPKGENDSGWGLGWWRQGDGRRACYFGTQASSGTIGHQGWTGTLVMIDPGRELVIAYLTNKIHSRITDPRTDANRFDGSWYTASSLGFVPQILSVGMDGDQNVSDQLLDLARDMAEESRKLVPEGVSPEGSHPAVRNVKSKTELYRKLAETWNDKSFFKDLSLPPA